MLQLEYVGVRDKILVVIVRVARLTDADSVIVMVIYSIVVIVIIRQQIHVLRTGVVIVLLDMDLLHVRQ